MKKRFFSIFLLALPVSLLAQVSQGGAPYSLVNKLRADVSFVNLPAFDVEQLIAEDAQNPTKRLRCGKAFSVDYNIQSSGKLLTLDNGDKLWRMGFTSNGALSMGIIFDRYRLPDGAKVFIYSTRNEFIGAFTSSNNSPSELLAMANVPGDSIVVEYFEPADAQFGAELNVGTVIHSYRSTFGSADDDFACMPNINCPAGNNWQAEKRAVAKITFVDGNYQYLCTGALVNNTSNNGTPYFLTAHHCFSTQQVASSAVFYFNYEAQTCSGTTGSGQTMSGSTLRATPNTGTYDYLLVQINGSIPSSYKPYFAGWNRGTSPATSATCIHHPGGALKRISVENDALTTGSFTNYISNSHWTVSRWEVGATAGGSSGSPLFDQNKRIVGDLTGGASTCANPIVDKYQKFSLAWEASATSGMQQLKYWLDPAGTNPVTLDGYDPHSAGETTVFSEGFNGTTFPPTGWTTTSASSQTWKSVASLTIGTTNPITINPQEGTKFAYVPYHSTDSQNEWLITPAMNFTGATGLTLKFFFNGSYYWSVAPNNNCNLRVKARIGDGQWSDLWGEDNIGEWPNYEWREVNIPLTNYQGSSNVKFALVYSGTDGAGFGIDNFVISKINTPCQAPTLTAVANGNSANLSWNVISGSTGYNIFRNGVLLKSNHSSTSFTDANLPNGQYTYKVQTICANAQTSPMSNEQVVIIKPSSIDGAQAERVAVYPNPTSGDLHVETDRMFTQYQVVDALGQVIISNNIDGINFTVNTEKLKQGIYFIKMSGSKGELVLRKFVKN